jgi:DoxX-like family
MSSSTQNVAPSRKMLLAGRIVSALSALFLLFDAIIKVLRTAPAVEGTVRLGYPVVVVVPIGITLLLCVVLYLLPRTSVLGAILITGYLGGATATQVRVEVLCSCFLSAWRAGVAGLLLARWPAARAYPLRGPPAQR